MARLRAADASRDVFHEPEERILGCMGHDDRSRLVAAHAVHNQDFHLFLRKIIADDRFQAAADEVLLVAAGNDDSHQRS